MTPLHKTCLLQSGLADKYSPLYLLSAVGAGGLSVSFFIWLMFLTPHPGVPVATADSLMAWLSRADAWAFAGTLLAWGAALLLGGTQFLLLGWNVREYALFKKSPGWARLHQSNAVVQKLAWPLALAMGMNAGFVFALLAVPGLWSVIEYIFPIAIAGFVLIGGHALLLIARILGDKLSSGGFDCGKNNSFSMMLPAFALSMVAVGLSGSAAMSQNPATVLVAFSLSAFFLTLSVLSAFVYALKGLNALFSQGASPETSATLWVGVPIATLVAITLYRLAMSASHHFAVEVPAVLLLGVFVAALAVQTMFLTLGWAVMRKNGALVQAFKHPTPLSFALVCPGVGFFVLLQFFLFKGVLPLIPNAGSGVLLMAYALAPFQLVTLVGYVVLLNRLMRPPRTN